MVTIWRGFYIFGAPLSFIKHIYLCICVICTVRRKKWDTCQSVTFLAIQQQEIYDCIGN